MPRKPHKQLALAQRRLQVAELYLQAWSQRAIAEQLGVAQSTVSSDLKAIHQEWRQSAIRDFDAAVAVELKKLDRLEREAWQGWQRSQQPQESTKVTQAESGKRAEKRVEQHYGDPRFLELVHRSSASRRALLGLDAPTRIAPTSPDGGEAYHAHIMMELMRLSERAQDGPVVIDAEFIEQKLQGSGGQEHDMSEAVGPER